MKHNRTVIKIAGESGQGLNLTGDLVAGALKDAGYFVFGYREYPSLIKGGVASYQLDISIEQINASISLCDILICMSRMSIHEYLSSISEYGILIHTLAHFEFGEEEKKLIADRNLQVFYVDTRNILEQLEAPMVAENVLLSGFVWHLLGLEETAITRRLEKVFEKKPKFIPINLKCLAAGLQHDWKGSRPQLKQILAKASGQRHEDALLISGNEALALGSLSAGTKAFYGYPMTPASSILSYLTEVSGQTRMIARQVEDEITAAQMALGSMFMGTRAFTATSGGGFDLMTETVSLAEMTETPFVCVLAQRPGPATGLPTWTTASDLELAIYAGHGESTRCVLAASDAMDANTLIQEAFNIAEEFQLPVIVLTEKQIAEGLYTVLRLPEPLVIKRHLTNNPEPELARYKLTKDGISPRWLPGTLPTTFNANSDEHDEVGNVDESGKNAKLMQEKRLKKLDKLKAELGEPVMYGNRNAQNVLVGWGSTKASVIDALNILGKDAENWAYLHYTYLFPLRTGLIKGLMRDNKRLFLVEQNATGQLGKLLKQEVNLELAGQLLKYDGRQLFVDEVVEFMTRSH